MSDTFKPLSQTESQTANNPDLDESGKPRVKAISSGEQAHTMAVALEKDNQERNQLNAIVLSKYNGGLPYTPAELEAAGEEWRSNASFGFMSGIVNRITPPPIQAIDNARYLTHATLQTNDPEDVKKSEFFQQEITRTIRGWVGWRDFNSALWQEDVLHGYAAPLNLNPYSPWPKMFKGDEVFLPDGTGQHARNIPVLAAKEDLLIHEFCEFLKDGPEIASAAHWKWEACLKAVEEALPKRQAQDPTGDNARQWQDAIREGNKGASFGGAKVIKLYHVLATEPDTKKVTHFIVNRDGNHEVLFQQDDRFDSMEDVATLFTLQPGNGKYYSSIGVGRMTLNAHIATESSRNGMLDNLRQAGMMIFYADASAIPSFQLKMFHPFMVVSSAAKIEQQKIESNVESYIQADDQVGRWMEQSVGTYLSGLTTSDDGSQSDKTATEANIEAQRDAAARTSYLARGLGQAAYLIAQITRRLCDPETTDSDALYLQKCLMDPEQGNMTREEIKKLANAPAAEVVQDLTQMDNQKIMQVYPTLVGNPNIDQERLLERYLDAAVNSQFQKDVQLDEKGMHANEAEEIRQQIGETQDILKGDSVPVSDRDDHATHLKVIYSDLQAGIPNIAKQARTDPSVLDHVNAQLVHAKAHIQMMKDAGAKPDETKDFDNAQHAFEGLLHKFGQDLQGQMQDQQKQMQEQQSAEGAQGAPAAQGGAPEDIKQNVDILLAWLKIYPDADPSIKRQIEALCGLNPVQETAPPAAPAMPPPPDGEAPTPVSGGSPSTPTAQ